MTSGMRRLIVNADDFGMSVGVNAGVVRTFEHGVVTSTSLLVRRPAAADAAAYARAHARLGVGLHVDLGEWIYRDDRWVTEVEVVSTEDAVAVGGEIRRQLERFRTLLGVDPTHLDSHQHVHQADPAASILAALARELGVPLRGVTPSVDSRGDFYGQTGRGEPLHDAISVDALLAVLTSVPPGITELTCHPGLPTHTSTYAEERAIEVETLCDPSVRGAIAAAGITLVSFAGCASDHPT